MAMTMNWRTLVLTIQATFLIFFTKLSTQQSILDDMSYPSDTDASCVKIPPSIKLCRNLEYKEMRLPNLLGHDSLPEVESQSRSWVPLLTKHCHPDLKLFLCSLFTPVCIKDNNTDSSVKPGVVIYPCRSLCESVKDRCEPVMDPYGFSWPKMLDCNTFPDYNGMCVEPQNTVIPTLPTDGALANNNNSGVEVSSSIDPAIPRQCAPCGNNDDLETMMDHFCANEFVLKVKIKKSKKHRSDRKITPNKKKKFTTVYKKGPLMKSDLKKLQLYIKNGIKCPCSQLEENVKQIRRDFFLIMGRKHERRLLITVLHRWPKKNKTWRKIDAKFKANIC